MAVVTEDQLGADASDFTGRAGALHMAQIGEKGERAGLDGPGAFGLEFEGQVFSSLSAVAKHITCTHCNGYLFFRMTDKGDAR